MTVLPLQTLTVDPATVKERLDAYREAAKVTRTAEDRLLAHAYYQASRGRQIISLAESVRAGGLDENGFPRSAVARAIAKRVRLSITHGGVTFQDVNSQTSEWTLRGDLGWFPSPSPGRGSNATGPPASTPRWCRWCRLSAGPGCTSAAPTGSRT